MTTVVLIAGSWAGGWIWRRVAESLEADGLRVVSPSLTGLAERHHLATPDTDLSTHITDLVNTLHWRELDDVVLVGHSYGGMVVTGAMQVAPERVSSAVYVDAFVPAPGQSAFDLLPWLKDAFAANAAPDRPWLVKPLDYAPLGVTDAADLARLEQLSTPLPLKTHEEPLPRARDAVSDARPPRSFIHCTGTPFFDEVAAGFRSRGETVVPLDAGHMAPVTHPEALAQVLRSQVQMHAKTTV